MTKGRLIYETYFAHGFWISLSQPCVRVARRLRRGRQRRAGRFASPTAAVEAFYRTQQSDNADALLACYPEAVRDYIVEQSGGKNEFEKSFEQSSIDPTAVEVYYIDEDTDEMNERCATAQQAYADKGIDISLEKYVEAYCTLIVNGDESQAQDRTIPCGLVDGKWYVLY